MNEIVAKCDYGIDLHTGAIHRSNLPQIRACLDDSKTKSLAEVFNVPVLINSILRDGSLREAARELNIPMLLFEGGEALRFDEKIAKSALQGIISLMCKIGMLEDNIYQYETKMQKVHLMKALCEARIVNEDLIPISFLTKIREVGGDQSGLMPENYYGYAQVRKVVEIEGQLYCKVRIPILSDSSLRQYFVKTFPICTIFDEKVRISLILSP